jgi:hypothetical protein
MPPPTRPRTKAAEIRERLGTYFLGLAIGCMMVIALLMLRRVMVQGGPPPAPSAGPPASTGP